MLGLLCLSVAIVLFLAIVGSVLGFNHKLVVYDSRTDLHVTCASIGILTGSGIALCFVRD